MMKNIAMRHFVLVVILSFREQKKSRDTYKPIVFQIKFNCEFDIDRQLHLNIAKTNWCISSF